VATLRSLTIQNFKGIKDPVKIEFKPITLLFGPNSAGKSTIIQALIYAREIFVNRNLDPYQCEVRGERIDLGGFRALVHNHDPLPIILDLELDLVGEGLPEYTHDDQLRDQLEEYSGRYLDCLRGARSVSVRVSISWDDKVSSSFVESYRTAINGEIFCEIIDWDFNLRSLMESKGEHRLLEIPELQKIWATRTHTTSSRINLRHSLFSVKDEEGQCINLLAQMANSLLEKHERYQWTPDPPTFLQSCLNTGGKVLLDWDSQIEYMGDPSENSDLDTHKYWRVAKGFDELLSRAVVGPGKLVRDSLRDLRHLGPLRAIPPRILEQSQIAQEKVSHLSLSTWEELFGVDDKTLGTINDWMGPKRLNAGYNIDRKHYREFDSKCLAASDAEQPVDLSQIIDEVRKMPERIKLSLRPQDSDSGMELSFRDVGTGVSQVMPVVIAALISRDQIVAIEQPELHIHPALQVKLGDLFISRIRESRALFILETHSEHLLLRIMRRMRETAEGRLPEGIPAVNPDDVVVLYVERDGPRTIVREMPLNERGELVKAWPGGFFEEGLREVF
jgi:ABC-type ATPase involved in cell division